MESFMEEETPELPDKSSMPCDDEHGIDETEFITAREESAGLFARTMDECSAFSFQDILGSLGSKKVARRSLLSRVELDPSTKRLILKNDRSNIRSKYGYDLGKDAYLYPEEALYLLELGKVEIFCDYISLSVQRARSLLLVSHRMDAENLINCTDEEYLVYKYLTRMGYSLYRFNGSTDLKKHYAPQACANWSCENEQDSSNANCAQMGFNDNNTTGLDHTNSGIIDIDESVADTLLMGSSEPRKSLKRKHLTSLPEDDQNSVESVEMMDSSEDNYSPTHCEGQAEVPYFYQDSAVEPGGYTVDEADSDVEIVDEVIYRHGGVEIQEISHCVGCPTEIYDEIRDDEPVASTSKGVPVTEVVVDLVSSEDEETDLRSFGNRIWSKFIPNSKLMFSIPPSKLIPQTIIDNETMYEFDLKDKSDVSDLELEFLVDEVSLNDERHGMDPMDSSQYYPLPRSRTWKEWRQSMFREARNVMNDSLLASSEYINGEAAAKKLFLWEEQSRSNFSLFASIVFKMFGPVGQGFSRVKACEGNPTFYVLVARQDEQVPDFGSIGACIDDVPVLVAIVCDSGENDIIFMTADRSPLSSLF